ncbi:ring-cleaving dioxygenase [Aerococcaceae bacterium WGS1372]
MGLKLIKQTVNFDDPKKHHFYYSNKNVDNGTILTFFPWNTKNRGLKGSGQVGRIIFSVPKGSIAYWQERLTQFEVLYEVNELFGQSIIHFDDTHSVRLAIIESKIESDNHDIIGFFGVELLSDVPEKTRETLVKDLGLNELSSSEEYLRFETVGDIKHTILIPKETAARGRDGVGTVHHIAWSMPDEDIQKQWQIDLLKRSYCVTDIKDRNYFKAMYMKEFGGVIFEFATDGPGFSIDEPVDSLGQKLMLPEQYEAKREEIMNNLPKFTL